MMYTPTSYNPSGARWIVVHADTRRFETRRETLTKHSQFFRDVFMSREHLDTTYIRIDCHGSMFERILQFMRHGSLPFFWHKGSLNPNLAKYNDLLQQARYLGIKELVEYVESGKFHNSGPAFPLSSQDRFSFPGDDTYDKKGPENYQYGAQQQQQQTQQAQLQQSQQQQASQGQGPGEGEFVFGPQQPQRYFGAYNPALSDNLSHYHTSKPDNLSQYSQSAAQSSRFGAASSANVQNNGRHALNSIATELHNIATEFDSIGITDLISAGDTGETASREGGGGGAEGDRGGREESRADYLHGGEDLTLDIPRRDHFPPASVSSRTDIAPKSQVPDSSGQSSTEAGPSKLNNSTWMVDGKAIPASTFVRDIGKENCKMGKNFICIFPGCDLVPQHSKKSLEKHIWWEHLKTLGAPRWYGDKKKKNGSSKS